MNSIFAELKHRHVFRVVGIYALAGWLLMQLSTHFEDALNLPGWFDTFVTLVVLIGFPIAVILAWVFDLTPEGLKKTSELSDEDHSGNTATRRPHLLLLLLIVVAVSFLAWHFSRPDAEETPTGLVLSANDKSIAVLPFIALSADEDDAYFGKGLAEELLNALTKFPELKVAARTSAFSFEGQSIDLREVGRKLGVAHVLEGSVRSAGNRVRVTAQLIRAADGFHLWSETYDRRMSDLFELQDEIVAAINRTLQIRLGVGVGAIRAVGRQVDPAAYQNYLRGLELWGTRSNVDNRREAVKLFQRVTGQDSNFADGWSAYGVSLVYSEPAISGMTYKQHYETAADAFERALALDPENVRALSGLAAGLLMIEPDIDRALQLAERAVEIAPNASLVHYAKAWVYELHGDLNKANQAYERAIALDPLNAVLQRVRALHVNAIKGDYDGVMAADADCKSCSDDDRYVFALAGYLAARRGGTDDQVRESAQRLSAITHDMLAQPEAFSANWDPHLFIGFTEPAFVDWYLGGEKPPEDSLTWLRDISCELCDLEFAPIFASLGEYDAAFQILDLSRTSNGGILFYIINPIGRDAWPDDFRRDPRFHAFWQREGLPEIADILRANGVTGGLPLPLEYLEYLGSE